MKEISRRQIIKGFNNWQKRTMVLPSTLTEDKLSNFNTFIEWSIDEIEQKLGEEFCLEAFFEYLEKRYGTRPHFFFITENKVYGAFTSRIQALFELI